MMRWMRPGAARAAVAPDIDVSDAVEMPGNFHMLVAHICFLPEADVYRKAKFYACAVLLTVAQLLMVAYASLGILYGSCFENTDCTVPGTWCSVGTGICQECQLSSALDAACLTPNVAFPFQGNGVNVFKTYRKAADLASMCSACLGEDGTTLSRDAFQEAAVRMGRLRLGDWVTIIVILMVVGVQIAAEIRDVMVCTTISRARDAKGSHSARRWTWALEAIALVRQYAVLPYVVSTVPMMIAMRGADAVNVVMNALALLFALELDNFIFDSVINEGTKAKFVAAGHLNVSAADASRMERSKVVYVTLTSIGTGICIQQFAMAKPPTSTVWYCLLFAFGPAAGLLEAWVHGCSHGPANWRGLAVAVGKAAVKAAVGDAIIAGAFLIQGYP